MINKNDSQKLNDFYKHCNTYQYENIGYPENADFDYLPIFKFLKFSLNNVGDPYSDSTYPLNSLKFEKEVIEFFSNVFGISKNESWGYVTNGGTEGNLYGLYLGREMYPKGILYFSEDTHYSVYKILRLLKMPYKIIKSSPNGEMDYLDLEKNLLQNKDRAAIILSNIGTTMKGAVDDLSMINNILKKLNIKDHYIHCDAALSGGILPFIKNEHHFGFKYGADSIAISGHKFIGSPIPCGVVIAKNKNIKIITRMIDYIAAPDNTIMGSRNGLTPLLIWYAIKELGYDGFNKRALECLKKAEYAERKFNENGIKAWRNKDSITVVFPKPSEKIWRKWCLAQSGNWAHIITSAHISYERIDSLIEDVKKDLLTKKINQNV